MGFNIKTLMEQAEKVKRNIEDVKKRLNDSIFEGVAGGGLVRVGMTGGGAVKWVNIDNTLTGDSGSEGGDVDAGKKLDKEMVEDLLVVAFNNARSNVDNATRDEMKKAGLPDVDAPF